MRVTSMVPDMQYQMQQSAQALSTAEEQLATGKRVNQISDDPSASANMIRSLATTANVDTYTSNVSSTSSQLQTADSAITNVVSALNQAITLGTEGANGTVSASNRDGIATQVQGILSTVVSQANVEFQGQYLFGGTNTSQVPFTADSTSPNGYVYNGNSATNQVQVGESTSVNTSLDGGQFFTSGANVLGSLTQLATALQSGSTTDIGNAVTAVTSALGYIDQQRVPLDNSINQLSSQETFLSQETITLTSQQTSLVGIDTATAATNLSQAETQNSAVLAAAAKVLPQTLLDYLQ